MKFMEFDIFNDAIFKFKLMFLYNQIAIISKIHYNKFILQQWVKRFMNNLLKLQKKQKYTRNLKLTDLMMC